MDYLLSLGLVVGIILVIVSMIIPSALENYKIASLISGGLLLVFCGFQSGRLFETDKYAQQKLIDAAHISTLETKSAIVDTRIITEYVNKIKYIDKIKEIKTNVYITKEDDIGCVIGLGTSIDTARMLNNASKGLLPDTTN